MNEPPQKQMGKDDFSKIPNGAPGIETRLMLVWDGGVRTGKIDMHRFVEIVAANPARMFVMAAKYDRGQLDGDSSYGTTEDRHLSASTHHMRVDADHARAGGPAARPRASRVASDVDSRTFTGAVAADSSSSAVPGPPLVA
jgi:hypothetical protein